MSDLLNWEWPHPEQSAAETIAQFDPACAEGATVVPLSEITEFMGKPLIYWRELDTHGQIHNCDDVVMACAVQRARAYAAEARLKEAVGLLRHLAKVLHVSGHIYEAGKITNFLSSLDRKDAGHAS